MRNESSQEGNDFELSGKRVVERVVCPICTCWLCDNILSLKPLDSHLVSTELPTVWTSPHPLTEPWGQSGASKGVGEVFSELDRDFMCWLLHFQSSPRLSSVVSEPPLAPCSKYSFWPVAVSCKAKRQKKKNELKGDLYEVSMLMQKKPSDRTVKREKDRHTGRENNDYMIPQNQFTGNMDHLNNQQNIQLIC